MEYTPLRISTIKPKTNITFDLYIFFQEQFLKYIDCGNAIGPEHLVKLRKQKIARFFITDEDEVKYQQFLDTILQETLEDDSTPVEEKCELAEGAAGTAVERMQQNPASEKAYAMTEKAGKNLRQIVSKNPGALQKIFGSKGDATDSEKIIKHCLNVCALSTKIGEAMSCSEEELNDLATASLVHDIGLVKMAPNDRQLFNKPRDKFTPDDRRIYNFHPKDGAQILNDKKFVTPTIIDLILNHEERLSGIGPQKKHKLEKLEEILAMTDCYELKISVGQMTPREAIKDFQVSELGNFNLKNINILKEVIKNEGLLD